MKGMAMVMVMMGPVVAIVTAVEMVPVVVMEEATAPVEAAVGVIAAAVEAGPEVVIVVPVAQMAPAEAVMKAAVMAMVVMVMRVVDTEAGKATDLIPYHVGIR